MVIQHKNHNSAVSLFIQASSSGNRRTKMKQVNIKKWVVMVHRIGMCVAYWRQWVELMWHTEHEIKLIVIERRGKVVTVPCFCYWSGSSIEVVETLVLYSLDQAAGKCATIRGLVWSGGTDWSPRSCCGAPATRAPLWLRVLLVVMFQYLAIFC